MVRARFFFPVLTAITLAAQEPNVPDILNLRQTMGAGQQGAATPQGEPLLEGAQATRGAETRASDTEATRQKPTEQERLQMEIASAKAREKAPKRFAEDLFRYRQASSTTTDGGCGRRLRAGNGGPGPGQCLRQRHLQRPGPRGRPGPPRHPAGRNTQGRRHESGGRQGRCPGEGGPAVQPDFRGLDGHQTPGGPDLRSGGGRTFRAATWCPASAAS